MLQSSKNEQDFPVPAREKEPNRLLLIDDNAELLSAVQGILSHEGFDVYLAQNAEEALQYLNTQIPDIIICDIMMPEINGYDFRNQIAANKNWFDIPFIFLTALSDPEEVRRGRATGCDDYLTKPFDPADLVSIIRGKLALSQHRRNVNDEKIENLRRRIIHTFSHEFRTPLVAVNTGTELLLDQFDNLEKSEVIQLLKSVHRGGKRLQRLVDDFMTLQQVESGIAESACQRLRQKNSLVHLTKTAFEISKRTEPLPEGTARLNLPPAKDESAYSVDVYDAQIIDVLRRLLSNASKFGGKDNLTTISFRKDESNCSVLVRDGGPGLSKKNAEEARKLFAQIDREQFEQQGCGIGLSIAHYYAGLNGGALFFHEPANKAGLEVELRFPILA